MFSIQPLQHYQQNQNNQSQTNENKTQKTIHKVIGNENEDICSDTINSIDTTIINNSIWIVLGSWDKTCTLLKVDENFDVQEMKKIEMNSPVLHAIFIPNEKCVTGEANGKVTIVDMKSSNKSELFQLQSAITGIDFDNDKKTLLITDLNGDVVVVNIENLQMFSVNVQKRIFSITHDKEKWYMNCTDEILIMKKDDFSFVDDMTNNFFKKNPEINEDIHQFNDRQFNQLHHTQQTLKFRDPFDFNELKSNQFSRETKTSPRVSTISIFNGTFIKTTIDGWIIQTKMNNSNYHYNPQRLTIRPSGNQNNNNNAIVYPITSSSSSSGYCLFASPTSKIYYYDSKSNNLLLSFDSVVVNSSISTVHCPNMVNSTQFVLYATGYDWSKGFDGSNYYNPIRLCVKTMTNERGNIQLNINHFHDDDW